MIAADGLGLERKVRCPFENRGSETRWDRVSCGQPPQKQGFHIH
jgi:hypothetical protein